MHCWNQRSIDRLDSAIQIKLNVLISVLGFRLLHSSLDEIQSLAVRVVHPNHLMYFIHSNALKPEQIIPVIQCNVLWLPGNKEPLSFPTETSISIHLEDGF